MRDLVITPLADRGRARVAVLLGETVLNTRRSSTAMAKSVPSGAWTKLSPASEGGAEKTAGDASLTPTVHA